MFGESNKNGHWTWAGSVPRPPNTPSLGIVPRAIHDLVNYVAAVACRGVHVQLTFSFLQVYMENISDLLNPSVSNAPSGSMGAGTKTHAGLQIREDPLHGIYVSGLTQVIAGSDPNHVIDTVAKAAAYRATHATGQNTASSRSHALLQFTIEQCTPPDPGDGPAAGIDDPGPSKSAWRSPSEQVKKMNVRRSTLTLVDLAGRHVVVPCDGFP